MVKPTHPRTPAEHEVCRYPDCHCPFDAPADPNWCARRLPKARPVASGQIPPRQSPPSPPPMADLVYGCDEHYRGGCNNCGAGQADRTAAPPPSLLASRAFWMGGACSILVWSLLAWAIKVWME